MSSIQNYFRNTFASLSIRNYRLYFVGQAISLSGTWMQTVAQGWLVLELTGSGTQLGGMLAFQFLPILFLGPWGGVITDRFNKRTLLYWTQSVSGVLALALGALVYTNTVEVWMIYAFALALGLIKVIDNPARQTFVSEMVGEVHVRNAITLNSTSANLARVIGPAIGGFIIILFGLATSFFFNGLSYIAVIAMLYAMREKELAVVVPTPKEKGQLRAGWVYVKNTPLIRNILLIIAVIGMFAYEFQVSLPLLAYATFTGGAELYASLLSAFGLGSVIGGLFTAGRKHIAPHQLVLAVTLFGVSMLALALAPSVELALFATLIVGFFSIQVTSLANTMIQLKSDVSMRGRVMALWSVAMFGSTPIGGPIVGFVGEYIGARWGIAIGGIATLLSAVFAYYTLLERDITEVVPEEVTAETEELELEEDIKY